MIKRGRRGEAPSLTTYSITLKVKWQREPPLSTQWRRQRGCLQAPALPPSLRPRPRSRNYFPIRRNYRRGQFTCRLPFEHSAPRPPLRRRRNRGLPRKETLDGCWLFEKRKERQSERDESEWSGGKEEKEVSCCFCGTNGERDRGRRLSHLEMKAQLSIPIPSPPPNWQLPHSLSFSLSIL